MELPSHLNKGSSKAKCEVSGIMSLPLEAPHNAWSASLTVVSGTPAVMWSRLSNEGKKILIAWDFSLCLRCGFNSQGVLGTSLYFRCVFSCFGVLEGLDRYSTLMTLTTFRTIIIPINSLLNTHLSPPWKFQTSQASGALILHRLSYLYVDALHRRFVSFPISPFAKISSR